MPATAGEVLQAARVRLAAVSAHPRRDVLLLLSHVLGCTPVFLTAHPEQTLSAGQVECFESLLQRRIAFEPIQYIVGEQEFFGLKFEVTPDVLIPRPETEHLVEAVLHLAPRGAILDVGTGSGAIAVTLAYNLPGSHVTAVDISPAALQVAKRNAMRHQVSERVTFLQSDLLAAVQGRFDVIVSNPPYVAKSEILEPQVDRYEPHVALYAGTTGLEVYSRLISEARQQLNDGGLLVLEIGFGQSGAVNNLLTGWRNVTFADDLQGIPRIVKAEAALAPTLSERSDSRLPKS